MEEALYDNYPLKAGVVIPTGTLAEVKNGIAAPAGTSVDPNFFVFALNGASNVGGADGDAVLVRAEFRSSYLFTVQGGVSRSDLGKTPYYALDNQTVTAAGPGNGFVGYAVFLDDDGLAGHHVGDGTVDAYIQIDGPLRRQSVAV